MQGVIQNSAEQGTDKDLAAMGAQAEETCKVMKAVLKVSVSFSIYCRVVLNLPRVYAS